MHYLKKFAAVARGPDSGESDGPIDGWKMLEDDGNDHGINRFGHFTLTSFDHVHLILSNQPSLSWYRFVDH